MANANQTLRSGNEFGRIANTAYDQANTDGINLKPGYLCRIRDRYHLVTAIEPLAVDVWFSDTLNLGFTVTSGEATANGGTHINAAAKYDLTSMAAYFDVTTTTAAADYTGNILATDFDSGHLTFDDLEPFKGNLYQLCPTLPLQPKYMTSKGGWHSQTVHSPDTFSATAASSFQPVGFPGARLLSAQEGAAVIDYKVGDTMASTADDEGGIAGVVHANQMGTVSAKLYVKHPAGVPKNVLDEAPLGESGTQRNVTKLEGISGFVDGSMSCPEAPNWDYSLWIEHGENNLPSLRLVNDSDEFLIDGRVRFIGWKYRILELSDEQLAVFKQKSGGRLRFVIINSTGLPVSGSMLADYFPK
jgi:hypothetical protein